MKTRTIIILFVLFIVAVFVAGIAKESKQAVSIPTVPPLPEVSYTEPVWSGRYCYYYSNKTASGLYDKASMRINLDGTQVTGEFNSYPAEKDSSAGTFTGTTTTGPRIATVIWNVMAEGMQSKNELLIKYSDTSAQVAYGEMVQGANGVYVYKDKANAIYQNPIPSIDCAQLDEIMAVEKYVKANVATIVTDKAVAGGTWYTTMVTVEPATHIVAFSYEDGHVSGNATASYAYDVSSKKIAITNFVKAK